MAELCGNGHPIGADGLCSHERDFRAAADRLGLPVDEVRQHGWIEAERRAGRRLGRYAS